MTTRRSSLQLLSLVLCGVLLTSCHTIPRQNRLDQISLPAVILWAWERPENLESIDPRRVGIAFLAQTLTLRGTKVEVQPRRQPLKVPKDAKLIAVTRIESTKTTAEKVALSDEQKQVLLSHIIRSLALPQVMAIQIDYDAVSSERSFYREMMQNLRNQLPDNVPLSMTALASFCVGDPWIKDMPVDEAVPMVFRMGIDSPLIKGRLADGGDFTSDLCRRSYGVALDEPVQTSFSNTRRVYIFNSRSWSEASVSEVTKRFAQ